MLSITVELNIIKIKQSLILIYSIKLYFKDNIFSLV